MIIRRVERDFTPTRGGPLAVAQRGANLVPVERPQPTFLALAYSNGFVTVEITHEAVDLFVESTGSVPLPFEADEQTGDRHAYSRKHGVRAVYDRKANLREVTMSGRDGLLIRVNFPGAKESSETEQRESA